MKRTITLLTLALVANVAFAAPISKKKLGTFTVTEITPMYPLKAAAIVADERMVSAKSLDPEKVGRIITVAKDMVALGESIYTLVQKGKPQNTTEYAPVSVVPRDPMTKEIADPFDLEGFSIPVERTFRASLNSGAVQFTYKLIYSYGGSFNGNGKYLTAVQIVPASVKTRFGWNFNATMRVAGIMNHGTKADPIAGVLVAIKYQMSSWGQAIEKNDTLHIAGNGAMKSFGIK